MSCMLLALYLLQNGVRNIHFISLTLESQLYIMPEIKAWWVVQTFPEERTLAVRSDVQARGAQAEDCFGAEGRNKARNNQAP